MPDASSGAEHRLAALLAADAGGIVAEALGYMSADPFWQERYGERGRRFADEDGHYHLRYLSESLAARSPAPFERYAAWLQRVLNTRGMCTRHLDHHFASLASVLGRRAGSDAGAALRILEAGRGALAHTDADAAAVQRVAGLWSQGAVPEDGLPYSSAWDHAYLCDYAADGLALNTTDHLISHVAWTTAALVRRSLEAGLLRDHGALGPRVRDALAVALAVVPG